MWMSDSRVAAGVTRTGPRPESVRLLGFCPEARTSSSPSPDGAFVPCRPCRGALLATGARPEARTSRWPSPDGFFVQCRRYRGAIPAAGALPDARTSSSPSPDGVFVLCRPYRGALPAAGAPPRKKLEQPLCLRRISGVGVLESVCCPYGYPPSGADSATCRMLPLARAPQGVRGVVRPGALGSRTAWADEWCVGCEFWPVPCLAQRTVAPNPLHVPARPNVLAAPVRGSCVAYPCSGILALPEPLCRGAPLRGFRGSLKPPSRTDMSRRSARPGSARAGVPFSRVRCMRSRRGLRSPPVPRLIRLLGKTPAAAAVLRFPRGGGAGSSACRVRDGCYLVDPASSHMLVSKIKPCMCKYELIQTVKLRMAH